MARNRSSLYLGPGQELNDPNRLGLFEKTKQWVAEKKYDGIWCLIETDHEGCVNRLSTRTGVVIDDPKVFGLYLGMPAAKIAAEIEQTTDASLRAIKKRGWHQVYLFDIMQLFGRDCRKMSYEKRRELLASAFEDNPWIDRHRFVLSEYQKNNFEQFFYESVKQSPVEGLILKRIDSTYKPQNSQGKTDQWVRVKVQRTVDLYVMGTGVTEGRSTNLTLGKWNGKKIVEVQSISMPKGYKAKDLVGQVIECLYDREHESGRYRHLRFNRVRKDKTKKLT